MTQTHHHLTKAREYTAKASGHLRKLVIERVHGIEDIPQDQQAALVDMFVELVNVQRGLAAITTNQPQKERKE